MKCTRVISRFAMCLLALVVLASCTPAAEPSAADAAEPTAAATADKALQQAEAGPSQAPAASAASLIMLSSAFAEGAVIPDAHTYRLPGQCDGDNLSPALSWAGAPAGTQSFAIEMIDPDGGDWVHWIQFNIPAGVTSLPEAAGGPAVGVKGRNDFGELGYGGPCPPGGTHRYVFTLIALDVMLPISEGATLAEATTAIEGHVLEKAQLTGMRSRN